MSEHALLNPSSGEIWMQCTPAARAAAGINKSSSYMDEGSLAHKLSELLILRQLKRMRESVFKVKLALLKSQYKQYYNRRLLKDCQKYVAYVMAQYAKALKRDPHALIFVETRLSLRTYIPESFGTGDILIMGTGFVWFIDLKYGKGKFVDAKENTQLKIYAVGALEYSELFFDKPEEIVLTIYQPRKDNITSWETTRTAIMDWVKKELEPKAKLAWEGAGIRVAGDHCFFCGAKPNCAVHRKYVEKAGSQAFKEPAELTPDQIAEVLEGGAQLKAWITAVEDWALIKAKEGMQFPGFKIVTGKSNRYIKDTDKAVSILQEAGYENKEIFVPPKLKGIGDLEDLLGQDDFYYYLKDVIVKPDGAATLVPLSDKREALTPHHKATKFFKDEPN